MQAYAKARDLVARARRRRARPAPRRRHAARPAGHRPVHRQGDRRWRSTAASTSTSTKLDDETAIDVGEGAELRAALEGRLPQPHALERRRRADRGDGPHRAGARPRVPRGHRPLAAPHDRPRPQPRAAAAAARRDRGAQRGAGAPFRILTGMEVDILEDGSLDQDVDLLERLDVVVASVHSKLRMPEQEMTAPHGDGRRQPPRRHPRALHRPQGRGHRPAAEPVRRRHRVRGLRAVRHRGRDQLPPRAPGPARGAARSSRSTGTAASPSTPTPTRPASSSGRPTAATRRPGMGIEPERIVNTMSADDLVAWTETHATA